MTRRCRLRNAATAIDEKAIRSGHLMPTSMLLFLVFQGEAPAALAVYAPVFPDSRIDHIERCGDGETAPAWSVKFARFSIAGQMILCNDSPVKTRLIFTLSSSLVIACNSEDEQRRLSQMLKEGGELMRVGNYGVSKLIF